MSCVLIQKVSDEFDRSIWDVFWHWLESFLSQFSLETKQIVWSRTSISLNFFNSILPIHLENEWTGILLTFPRVDSMRPIFLLLARDRWKILTNMPPKNFLRQPQFTYNEFNFLTNLRYSVDFKIKGLINLIEFF